jgi:predicted Fe-S protein YdhL (DUF1289 family)
LRRHRRRASHAATPCRHACRALYKPLSGLCLRPSTDVALWSICAISKG